MSCRAWHGFTLIELVVTVAIVGLIASLAAPVAELVMQRSKEHELHNALRQIRTAIDAYKQAVDEGRILVAVSASGYPPTLATLVDGVTDTKNPNKDVKIYFLRAIPRDPMATDPTLSADATWGKRSYASAPDNPQEGDDVFDVYTRAAGTGLDGIEYRQW